jgi:hypothetical protein
MVDSTLNNIIDNIFPTNATGRVKHATDSDPQSTISMFKEIQLAILDQIKNPHINAKEQRDLIDALLQQL